jgi:hypothetical protein
LTTKRKKQNPAGGCQGSKMVDTAGIERVLRNRRGKQFGDVGHGRVITTVGDMAEIHEKLAQGYEILWCQMSKIVSSRGVSK